MREDFVKEAEELAGQLTAWRRALHRIPELGLNLPQTSALIQAELKKMGIPFEVTVGGSCVTALLGNGQKCFLLRSDMDALPMAEESGVPFASQNGCMHSCGHDMHAATLLGAAFLLKKHEAELKGRVKLLFQPGEETFEGAAAAIRDGLFKEPSIDAAFAMHVNSALPVGTILYGEYPMAAVYGFKITLTGVGGHGSAPEYCIDPINTGVHIYLALQELIARECPPSQEAALTIGQFQAGSASNIIPQTAVLQGTLRTFDKKLRETLVRRIRETAEGVAATYRTKIELEVLSDLPSVADDLELNREAAVCIQNMYPEMKLLPLFHTMASEDFSLISEQVPSGYFNIGAAVEEETEVYGQHNPRVRFNEKALPAAAAIYAGVAADWLERHSG